MGFVSKFPNVEQLLLAVEVSAAVGKDKQALEFGSRSKRALLLLLAVLDKANTAKGIPLEQQPKEIEVQIEGMLTMFVKDGTVVLDVPQATLLFSIARALGNNKPMISIDLASAMLTSPGLAIIWEHMASYAYGRMSGSVPRVKRSLDQPIVMTAFTGWFDDAWSSITDAVEQAAEAVKETAQTVVDAVESVVDKAKDIVKEGAEAVANECNKAWPAIEETASKIWQSVEAVPKDVWDSIARSIENVVHVWHEVEAIFKKLVNELSHWKMPKDGTMVCILEGLPVIGYAVAVLHWAAGDNAEALRAVGESTEALLSLIGAVAGAVVGGPAGAMAGSTLGAAIGLGIEYALGAAVHDGKVKATMQDLSATRIIITLLLAAFAGEGAGQVGSVLAKELGKGFIQQFLYSQTIKQLLVGIPKYLAGKAI